MSTKSVRTTETLQIVMAEGRTCCFCHQELAHTAYFRHLHDKSGTICPGKQKVHLQEGHSSGSESSELDSVSSDSSRLMDSTLDLSSDGSLGSKDKEDQGTVSDLCGQHKETNEVEFNKPSSSSDDGEGSMHFSSGFSNSSSDGCSTSSSDGEVWENSDTEEDITDSQISPVLHNLLFGITFFVYFFHLFYRLSEKGTVALLNFLKTLLSFVARVSYTPLLMRLAQTLPKSVQSICKCFRRDHNLEEFVVCPKCSHLYNISECIIRKGGHEESTKCTHVDFLSHPVHSRRAKCDTVLMKRVKVGRSFKLVPRKTFLYRNLVTALVNMARRPGFLQKCEHWRNNSDGLCGDIYDGRVWHDIKSINGRPFTELPNNLCLGMNIDWFNPYDETVYSVGAIYVVVLNLPRTE